MKLKETQSDILLSGNMEETDFSIDDSSLHIVFDILRSKVYKNPIGSICREIASNSRDAQREIGDNTTPIEIEISDKSKSIFIEDGLNIIFRDRGIGLSPERVKDIYSKYGASTKRLTNDMTGGFGLGAKTPFAYVDAFTVRTIVDNVEYVYSIYIDQTKRGKIALLCQEQLEHQGNLTEIIIPLSREDMSTFQAEVVRNTHFWPVRPKLINFSKTWTTFSTPNSNGTFEYEVKDNYSIYYKPNDSFVESNINAIIDGIYYPVDTKLMGYSFDYNHNFAICLYFNNGDLSISANRETLQYDKDTIDIIKTKVDKVFDSMKVKYDNLYTNITDIIKAFTLHKNMVGRDNFYAFINKNKPFTFVNPNNGKTYNLNQQPQFEIHQLWWYWQGVDHLTGGLRADKQSMRLFNDEFSKIDRASIHIVTNEEVEKKKGKLSMPINRTLFDTFDKKFLLIVQRPKDDCPYSYQNTYDEMVKKELEAFEELGITYNKYWEVTPTRVKHEKKDKKKIQFKTFMGGTYDRTKNYMIEEDGRVFYANKFKKDIVYYELKDEISVPQDLKEQLKDLSFLLSKVSKNVFIIAVGANKKQLIDKRYIHVDDFIKHNKKKIFKLMERHELNSDIGNAKKYKNIAFSKDIKDVLDHLLGMESSVEYLSIYSCKDYLKKNLPNFRFANHERVNKTFQKIRQLYPLISELSTSKIDSYVTMVNKLRQYEEKFGII